MGYGHGHRRQDEKDRESQGTGPRERTPHSHASGLAHASWHNWHDSGLPFGEKVKMALGNEWIKVRHFQRCCGHPGEPGC
jgi:hypothetical protein